ncbi:MAG: VanW family protein [Candidatus Flexifilum sp.]
MTTYPYDDRYPVEDEAPVGVWVFRLLLLGVMGAMLLAIILLGAVVVYQQTFRAGIFPGVRALGVDLAGMTPQAAAAALDAAFTYDDTAVFTLYLAGEDRRWQIPVRDLGLRFDAQATAAAAYAQGREGSAPDLIQQALIWLNGRGIAPIIHYDRAAALERLRAIAAEIDRPPAQGALRIEGTTVIESPPVPGRALDTETTLANLEAALLTLSPGGEIPLVVRETGVTTVGVSAAAARARAALSGPLYLVTTAADGSTLTWTIPPEQIAGLLEVVTTPAADGVTHYDVRADISPYRAELERLAPGLIIPERDGRFRFDPASGQLIPLEPAVHGRRLDIEATLAALQAAVFAEGDARRVPLAYVEALPTYHNGITAAELGIRELVAEGVSSYAGSSQARITNIQVAVNRFNGVIVPPGALFSFNETLGPITPEAGFVQSGVIFGGRTILGDGGGVCQVSTTLFRAVFFGGYPIAERWAHGYRVGYYENNDPLGVGMDAAIYVGELDFKFINDTPYHILIDAAVLPETATVRFRLYSTSVGRIVERQGPMLRDRVEPLPARYEVNPDLRPGEIRQVDVAAQGAYVEVTRIIRDAATGAEIDREIIASQYQPWGAIYQVAPGDPRAGT